MGRHIITQKLTGHYEKENWGKALASDMEGVTTIEEACDRLQDKTGITAGPVPFRKAVRGMVASKARPADTGIAKSSDLYAVCHIKQGRPVAVEA
jgi:hypothetical protein